MSEKKRSTAAQRTGFVWHELFGWHNAGSAVNHHPTGLRISKGMYHQHGLEHVENADTKRRLYSLLAACGLLDQLIALPIRAATVEELARFHTIEYIKMIKQMSDGDGGNAGYAPFGPGSYDIACRAVGACLVAVDSVMNGDVDNAYVLVRPPGHHAERDRGLGFCLFSNCALAALHAKHKHGLKRIAILDWDVHHGNGTQQAFYSDPQVLFISIHEANLYPEWSGEVEDNGHAEGQGFTINIPLPPGTGNGGYAAAFHRVILPALEAYQPELILVSCGYDAAAFDPQAHMLLSSDSYRHMASSVLDLAARLPSCRNRTVFIHEGGYSAAQVPFCGLAVIETLSNRQTNVVDPFLNHVENWPTQALQPHQDAAIRTVEQSLAKHFYPKLKLQPPKPQSLHVSEWPNANYRWTKDKRDKMLAIKQSNIARTLGIRAKL